MMGRSPEVLAVGFSAETRHRTRLDAEAHYTASMHADGTLVIEYRLRRIRYA
jgi:hypothetical protein